MIGAEWTTALSLMAVGFLLLALALLSRSAVRGAPQRVWAGGKPSAAAFLVCFLAAGALFLRPGEDTFTGLDVSAYRLMSWSLAEGRGLQGVDAALQSIPRQVRSLVLYRPEHHKTTRSQSYRLDSLESCTFRPFYYPLLPLSAVGFDKLVPGEARDYLPGFTGLVLTAVLLAAAFAELGPTGGFLVFFLVAGTAFPSWFFRGYYPEAIGAALIALALLSWFADESEGHGAAFSRSFALGLAFAFHPVLAVYSFPLFVLMAVGGRAGTLWGGVLHIGFYLAGALPLFLQTRYITAPYGSLGLGSIRYGMKASPAIRAVVLAAAALLALSALFFVRRRALSAWMGRSSHPSVAGRILAALAWTLPTLVVLVPGGSEAARAGARELLRGTGPLWLAPLALFAMYAFLAPGLGRVRAAGSIVAASLPLFLLLKGWEQGGLWSQRRLVPFFICFLAVLFPAAVAAVRDLGIKAGRRGTVLCALALTVCGLANFVRWPAVYLVREDEGAGAWVERQAAHFSGATVFFDYHPYSVPFAALGGNNVFGLGSYAFDRLAELAPFVSRKAGEGDFFWISAYDNPELEEGVRLVSQETARATFPVVRAKSLFPAVAAKRTVSLEVLRTVPLSTGERPPAVDKVMDRGPLGLRPPWGRADIPIRMENGDRLPARWSRQGSGIVGPVPLPGEEVIVTVEGVSGRAGNTAGQVLRLKTPWGRGGVSFTLTPELKRVTKRIIRQRGGAPGEVRTGTYRFYAEDPYDPARDGIRGFNSDLGGLLHRVRIEISPGMSTGMKR